MKIIYDISIYKDGETVELGSVAFDENNAATLTLAGNAPEHLELQKHWNEVDAPGVLEVMRTRRRQNDDGSWTRLNSMENVSRNSADYPPASMHFLSSDYGYLFAKRLEPVEN